MLYLIPTPIGNLEDITLRALRLLKEVDLILAEDTRTSGKLLKHYDIKTPTRPYHAHNEHAITPQLIEQLKGGQTFALITDAGTPGISDPGFLLARACHEAGIRVDCLPGATSIIPAVVASGLPCDKFHYEGFLPHKKGRKTRLEYLTQLPVTFIVLESPHRLPRLLGELADHAGPNRMACVCRELTKLHEEKLTAPVGELIERFPKGKVKGEIVVVVEGAKD